MLPENEIKIFGSKENIYNMLMNSITSHIKSCFKERLFKFAYKMLIVLNRYTNPLQSLWLAAYE